MSILSNQNELYIKCTKYIRHCPTVAYKGYFFFDYLVL